MKVTPRVETGLQLLSRLIKRPLIEGLDSRLFGLGPHAEETVEISGDVSSGKTLLLTQLVARCILPTIYNGIAIGGRGVEVLLINTDHHFRITKLVKLMHCIVADACKKQNIMFSSTRVRELVIIPAVENLTVVNCYDNGQFKLTLDVLDDILMRNPRIGLIALDSISSFYWQDREIGGVWLINRYLKNILKIVQKYIFQYKIVVIYTRPDDFSSNTGNTIELAGEPTSERINRRINLSSGTMCVVETADEKREIKFDIDATGIKWVADCQ